MSSDRLRFLYSLGAALLLVACDRAPERDRDQAGGSDESNGPIVEATWYEVPPDSLARRRAGEAELTAASDRYALGTRVKVTRVSNGQSVIVRITDTGLQKSAARIDLCAEAAERLGMIKKGVAKVRIAAVPNDER